MSPRKILVVVLGYVLSAAVIVFAPAAQASDNRPDREPCGPASGGPSYRLWVEETDNARLSATIVVFSDDQNLWDWKLIHNGEVSARGSVLARDADRSFRITRRMIDLPGIDEVVFRTENIETGQVCRGVEYH